MGRAERSGRSCRHAAADHIFQVRQGETFGDGTRRIHRELACPAVAERSIAGRWTARDHEIGVVVEQLRALEVQQVTDSVDQPAFAVANQPTRHPHVFWIDNRVVGAVGDERTCGDPREVDGVIEPAKCEENLAVLLECFGVRVVQAAELGNDLPFVRAVDPLAERLQYQVRSTSVVALMVEVQRTAYDAFDESIGLQAETAENQVLLVSAMVSSGSTPTRYFCREDNGLTITMAAEPAWRRRQLAAFGDRVAFNASRRPSPHDYALA